MRLRNRCRPTPLGAASFIVCVHAFRLIQGIGGSAFKMVTVELTVAGRDSSSAPRSPYKFCMRPLLHHFPWFIIRITSARLIVARRWVMKRRCDREMPTLDSTHLSLGTIVQRASGRQQSRRGSCKTIRATPMRCRCPPDRRGTPPAHSSVVAPQAGT